MKPGVCRRRAALVGHALALAAALAATPARAAERPDRLIEDWYEADDRCRAAVGVPRTAACDRRAILASEIAAAGWCIGRTTESVSGTRWSRCGAENPK